MLNYNQFGVLHSRYEYTLNNVGMRTSVTEFDGTRIDYTYDNLYRLTQETRTGAHPYSINYVYDNVGNRIQQTKNSQVTNYTYTNRDQLTTESVIGNTITYTYDASGKMVSKTDTGGIITYTWQDNDRMVGVVGPNITITYIYDAEGRRIGEKSSGTTKKHLIDAQLPYGQVVAEYSINGSLIASYTYGLERIQQDRGGVQSYYVVDGQGSIRQITDNNGTLTDTYDYTAFGELLNRTGSTVNDFTYTGEQGDPNAKFYYLRARWYDPGNGRFASVDPYKGNFQAPMSLHQYLYTKASPVSYIDPLGKNYTLAGVVMAISVSNILAAVAQPSIVTKDKGREPKSGEISFLDRVYVGHVDYGNVRLFKGGLLTIGNYGRTLYNNIYFPKKDYLEDFSTGTLNDKSFLVHEICHVWQNQKIKEYSWMKALWEHIAHRGMVYAYDINEFEKLTNYEYEQQAAIVQEYYENLIWYEAGRSDLKSLVDRYKKVINNFEF